MPYVDSSALEWVQYNFQKRQLQVKFRETGRTYVYFEVPEAVYAGFLNAESQGAFFNAEIRDRFAFKRLS